MLYGIRGKDGNYRGLVPATIAAFEDAGMSFYNEAILVQPAGNLALRVPRMFASRRKLGRAHQNVLVFFKGDPERIPDIMGETEFGELTEMEGEQTEHGERIESSLD